MNELNSIETQLNLDATPLSDQTKFRPNEINKIKDYFNSKIQEQKSISIKLSKYIAAFDYIDKALIVLSATSGGISTFPFTSVIGAPAVIASGSITLVFSLTTGIIKKIVKSKKQKKKETEQERTRKKQKKHNKIVMLGKSKLNSIETLISQSLIDLDITHDKFKTIVNEKEKHEQMKEHIRNTKSKDELTQNSKENSENP